MDESQEGDREFGRGVLAAILTYEDWCHRKVESLRLADGFASTWRVSLDITIPNDSRLSTAVGSSRDRRNFGLTGSLIPLGLLRKVPLRRFDAEIAASGPLLVADRFENGRAMTYAIAAAYELEAGHYPSMELLEAINWIACAPLRDHAEVAAEDLITTGGYRGKDVVGGGKFGPIAQSLLLSSSQNFLLAAYMDESHLGSHRLVKYSYAWQLQNRPFFPYWSTVATCFGLGDASVDIELNSSLMFPRSYHVEVHVPPQLLSVGLAVESSDSRNGDDDEVTSIAHAVVPANPLDVPDSARLRVRLAPPPLLALAAIGGLFTAAVLYLGLYLPGEFAHLMSGDVGLTVGIYLAIPGLFIVGLNRSLENPVVSAILGPLRGSLWFLVGCLFASGGALSFGLSDVSIATVWNISAFVGLSTGALSAAGYIRCRRLMLDRM